jgi:hypothetical protein
MWKIIIKLHYMNKLIISLIFIVSITNCYSQKAPLKFGDVSMEELQMTSTNLDTSASAVVLYDYGIFRASTLEFTRVVRVKILKKEGYNWANMSFQGDMKSYLRGVTSNLENGKMVQYKLKNESIFRTRIIESEYMLSAAMPNVKVGSVIDLEFRYDGMPWVWYFQEEIPVLHSELILEKSPVVTFRTNFSGYEKLALSTPTRWVSYDMPAFKEEPYMRGKGNYITKLNIDLLQVQMYSINSTWEKVNLLLFESSYFCMPSTSTPFLNELANRLSEKYKNKENLLIAAYDTIRESIVWNEKLSLTLADGNITNVYKMKVGNSAEVNLLLFKLLKKLDFDVTPLALSTRENGPISTFFPSLHQLNYAIIYVKLGEKEYFLDATEKYMPSYLLPQRCLNVQARLIDRWKNVWLTPSNIKKDKDLSVYNLELTEDLSLKGNMSCSRSDYSAFEFRKKYSKFNSQNEYEEEYLKTMPGLKIKELRFQNLDSVYKPVTEEQKIEIRNRISQENKNCYLVPLYFQSIRENPFKLDIRKYPIEFETPIDKTVILNLTIPEGYSVASLPQSITIKLPGNNGVFMYEPVSVGNKVSLTSKFGISGLTYSVEEYATLKEFYNQIIKKESEPIILMKN